MGRAEAWDCFLRYLRDRGFSGVTVNNYISKLRAVCEFYGIGVDWVRVGKVKRILSFNSLFEIRPPAPAVSAESSEALSILFLRFTCNGHAVKACGRLPLTFNSLFEIRGPHNRIQPGCGGHRLSILFLRFRKAGRRMDKAERGIFQFSF